MIFYLSLFLYFGFYLCIVDANFVIDTRVQGKNYHHHNLDGIVMVLHRMMLLLHIRKRHIHKEHQERKSYISPSFLLVNTH